MSMENFQMTNNTEDVTEEYLVPYLLSKTELTDEEVFAIIGEFVMAGVDTVLFCLKFKGPSLSEAMAWFILIKIMVYRRNLEKAIETHVLWRSKQVRRV